MRRLYLLTATLGPIVILAGCASKDPTFGEVLQAEGAGLAVIGDQWVEGQEKVERGEDLIEKGRRQVEEGRDKIDRGEDLVEEGRRLMEESERRYDARTGSS